MRSDRSVDSGLEGVVVAESVLSRVDGEGGRLIIRGHDLERLATSASYEEACALLWEGAEPGDGSAARYRELLARARNDAGAHLPALRGALQRRDGMDALRGSLAQLEPPHDDPIAQAAALTGATAVFAGAWARLRRGQAPLPPDPSLDHASDALRMATGSPQPQAARALGRYLVTVVDHGMNASTFTARVVASTGSDMVSAVVAAVGALKGPLHGGAPGPVLDMLDAIGEGGDARAHLRARLSAGERIMGMGHRIYRVRDPRAAVLEDALELLSPASPGRGRLRVARAVERAAGELLRERHPGRRLEANVEFYTAVLLDALGLDRAQFTPTFATGRVAGWCAHVLEQRATGRLIRPALRYVGPVPGLAA
jgi:citrate synthase